MVRKLGLIALCLLALGLSAHSAYAVEWGVTIIPNGNANVNDVQYAEIAFFDGPVRVYGWAMMAKGPDNYWRLSLDAPDDADTWEVRLTLLNGAVVIFGPNPHVADVDQNQIGMTIFR